MYSPSYVHFRVLPFLFSINSVFLLCFGASMSFVTTPVILVQFISIRAFKVLKRTAVSFLTAAMAEWLREWDTLTMFEATVAGGREFDPDRGNIVG